MADEKQVEGMSEPSVEPESFGPKDVSVEESPAKKQNTGEAAPTGGEVEPGKKAEPAGSGVDAMVSMFRQASSIDLTANTALG